MNNIRPGECYSLMLDLDIYMFLSSIYNMTLSRNFQKKNND